MTMSQASRVWAIRAVREQQFHRHVLVLRLELCRQLGDIFVPEAQRRQDAQAADQLVLAIRQGLLQLVHFGQDQTRAFGQQLPCVGQRARWSLTVEQFQLQLFRDPLQRWVTDDGVTLSTLGANRRVGIDIHRSQPTGRLA